MNTQESILINAKNIITGIYPGLKHLDNELILEDNNNKFDDGYIFSAGEGVTGGSLNQFFVWDQVYRLTLTKEITKRTNLPKEKNELFTRINSILKEITQSKVNGTIGVMTVSPGGFSYESSETYLALEQEITIKWKERI
jgi:hypothetical protein